MKSAPSSPARFFFAIAVVVIASVAAVEIAGNGGQRLLTGVLVGVLDLAFLFWVSQSVSRQLASGIGSDHDRERLAYSSAILEGSTDAIISKDLNGVIRSWNKGAERMFGFTAKEAEGRPISIIIPEDRIEEERALLERIRNGERVEAFETVRMRKGGERLEILVTVSPVRGDRGKIVGASKIARQITEEKRTERRMLATLSELNDIKAALDEHSIVATTDASGRITYVNDKFCAISKYSRGELIGQDHRIINSHHHPKEFFRGLWATIGRGQVWRGEIMNRAKDGSYYWVDTTIFPRFGESGKPTQYIAIRTDITQRKESEAILKRTATELQEKNRELETIVYSVSHDLRSPLVNVQGFSRQLTKACERIRTLASTSPGGMVPAAELVQPLETTIPQALRFITAGVNKMDLLLSGLLRVSRLGRVSFNVVPLEMNALIAEIIAATRFQLNEVKAEIEVNPLPPCLGDSVHTSQVFANLIENAVKYRAQGRRLRIVVSGRVSSGQAIYTVADNGIGIAVEHQGKIFEIFHRLNPDYATGEGLGLTLAQRMLERENGKIWVEGSDGTGSTFFVSLPAVERPENPQA